MSRCANKKSTVRTAAHAHHAWASHAASPQTLSCTRPPHRTRRATPCCSQPRTSWAWTRCSARCSSTRCGVCAHRVPWSSRKSNHLYCASRRLHHLHCVSWVGFRRLHFPRCAPPLCSSEVAMDGFLESGLILCSPLMGLNAGAAVALPHALRRRALPPTCPNTPLVAPSMSHHT